jgi:Lysozyme like domain/LysM domain
LSVLTDRGAAIFENPGGAQVPGKDGDAHSGSAPAHGLYPPWPPSIPPFSVVALMAGAHARPRQRYRGRHRRPPAHPPRQWLAAAALPVALAAAGGHYVVKPGDTLSSIAARVYGSAAAWPALWWINRAHIHDPNLIYSGQRLSLSTWHPERAWLERAAWRAMSEQPRQRAAATGDPGASAAGTLSCTGLEQLWESASGAPEEAFTAAEIAMAESGGRQYATGSYGERGYWQINPIHGALSTYNAWGNARAAVIISQDGTNWSPWTTYVDGAYQGQC